MFRLLTLKLTFGGCQKAIFGGIVVCADEFDVDIGLADNDSVRIRITFSSSAE